MSTISQHCNFSNRENQIFFKMVDNKVDLFFAIIDKFHVNLDFEKYFWTVLNRQSHSAE